MRTRQHDRPKRKTGRKSKETLDVREAVDYRDVPDLKKGIMIVGAKAAMM